jgi:branched-chain amino acid transport system permease protein
MTDILQLIVSGLVIGGIYSLIALGLAMIYKASDVVNFAQGELVMVGAYFGVIFHTILGLPFIVAFLLSLASGVMLGILIHRALLRPLIEAAPFTIIVATIGVGLILKNGIRLIFEDDLKHLSTPFSKAAIDVQGVLVTELGLFIVGICLFFTALTFLFFKFTKKGRCWQALAQNHLGALLVGIDIRKELALLWGGAGALGAVGGFVTAPLYGAHPEMGIICIPAFCGCIMGGFTSMPGAVAGGFILGVVQTFAAAYTSAAIRDIFAFVLMIAFILVRPQGLFGKIIARRV